MTYLWLVLVDRFELLLEATVFIIVHLLVVHFCSFDRLLSPANLSASLSPPADPSR